MSFLTHLHDIDTFIFDVDGVLTDAIVRVEEDGQLLRSMNTKDGFAIKHALSQGYKVLIITGGKSRGVQIRMAGLGVPKEDIYLGADDKLAVLRRLVNADELKLENCLYMGDDIPDYGSMRLVLLATCPKDAVHEIKEISQYVSPFDGGRGCVRDVIEKVLRVQGKWFDLDVVNL